MSMARAVLGRRRARVASTTNSSRSRSSSAAAHRVHQALVERRIGLVNAGRIEEHDLRARARVSTPWMEVRVVCGLSATMASFLPHQRIQQRGFAGVGPPDSETNPEL